MREQDLLKMIQSISQKTGFLGTGDDAAVFDDRVYSTDQFIEDTHFTFEQMSAQEIGYKGVVQALSDLAAMASSPLALLCSAAWPMEANEKILKIYQGIEAACLEYGVPLIGGDISRAAQTVLDFTVIGRAPAPPLLKSPQPGDLVAVTGPLGSAMAGLKTLGDDSYPALQRAFKKPVAHIQRALQLHKLGGLTGLTDISDSLSKSLWNLSRLGNCGFEIRMDKIPRLAELETLCEARQWPLREFLLSGGEDYQLLMTINPKMTAAELLDHGLTVIGHVKKAENTFIEGEKIYPLPEVGWDPFVVV